MEQLDVPQKELSTEKQEFLNLELSNLNDDGSFDVLKPDQVYAIADKHPDLVLAYLPLLKKDLYGDAIFITKDDILNTIKLNPEYACNLRTIFTDIPELFPLYANKSLNYYTDKQKEADELVTRSRLSTSTSPEVIGKHIENVRKFNQILRKGLQDVHEQDHTALDSAKRVATNIFGVADVWLTRIGLPTMPARSNDAISIRLTPTDYRQADFRSHDLRLRDIGLISSAVHTKDYPEMGYRFFTKHPFDEAAFLETLTTHPFGSKELITALEDIPSIGGYIENNLS